MTFDWVLRTGIETVAAPREVAQRLLDMQLSREALVTGFVLVAVLNTLMVSASVLMAPQDDMMRLVFSSPTGTLVSFMGIIAVTTCAYTWVGRVLGGTADLMQMATLTIWMQFLRFVAQIGLSVLALVSEGLFTLAVLGVSVLGLWITLNFVNVAHGFNSLGRSAMVLIGSVVAMALFLAVLLSFLGVGTTGL